MKIKNFLLLISLLFFNTAVFSQDRVETLIEILKNPQTEKVLVVAHRGDWRNAPENSLEAYRNCITMGADMVEVDIHQTKDKQYVLMHDQTIDRTTNGKGKISEMTLKELRQFYLKDQHGNLTSLRIPTLNELLVEMKGKILINIDKGYDYFQGIYDMLVQTNTLDQVIIKSGHPYDKIKKENEVVLKHSIYMPVINLNSPDAEKMIDDFLKIKPRAIECCFAKVTPDVLRLLKKIKDNGSKIWINSLWDSLNGGHSDETAVTGGKPDETWGWILDQGTSIIQSDRPVELMRYLEKKNRR